MNQTSKQGSILPVTLLFLTGTLITWGARNWIAAKGLHPQALLAANTLFFLLSLLIHRMQLRAARHSNPHVFVRAVMGGTMIKMAVVLGAAGVYAFAFRPYFNKATVVTAMCWYLAYLFVETRMSVRLNQTSHA